MVEEISDKIKEEIKKLTDDPNEQAILEELLQKTANYDKQTKPAYVKKEFLQLLDDHFPFKKESD